MLDDIPEHSPFYHAGDKRVVTQANLPHWDRARKLQFVTFRLADALPQSKLRMFVEARDAWLKAHPKPWDEATTRIYAKEIMERFNQWLDQGYGSCVLARAEVREEVEVALRYGEGWRYRLHAYVIMPNHVHLLFELLPPHTLAEALQAIKGFTAHRINRLLGRDGAFWQKESFGRMIRDQAHYDRVVRYIAQNPRHLPSGQATCVILAQETEDGHYLFPEHTFNTE